MGGFSSFCNGAFATAKQKGQVSPCSTWKTATSHPSSVRLTNCAESNHVPDNQWEDPIVKEVRDIRDQFAAELQHDLRALCKYLQAREQQEQRKLVTRAPRRPDVSKRAVR